MPSRMWRVTTSSTSRPCANGAACSPLSHCFGMQRPSWHQGGLLSGATGLAGMVWRRLTRRVAHPGSSSGLALREPIDTYHVMYYSRSTLPSGAGKCGRLGGWSRGVDESGTATSGAKAGAARTRHAPSGVCRPHRQSPHAIPLPIDALSPGCNRRQLLPADNHISARRRAMKRGFTLIELLVVIAIM